MFIPRIRQLVTLLAALLLAGNAWATCPVNAGVSQVDVALIDADGDGDPDIHSNDKERNEHARISSGLAAQLGITAPTGTVLPQIRVIVDNKPLPSGEKGTGVFSVFEVFTDSGHRVEVYANESSGDQDSGYFRLFETTSVTDFTTVDVTVHAQAPSKTTKTVNDGTPTVTEHFCEPHANTFVEEIHVRDDKRFALLVPHGGGIEANTSEQIETVEDTLATTWGVDANTWEAAGVWTGGLESEHWHITSKEASEDGFPGLADLVDEPQFDASRDFQYVASLHGMAFSKEGLVLGGRAHLEAKCLIAGRVRQRMAAVGLDVPAVYVWNYDSDLSKSIDLAHSDGTKITDPGERGSDPGLSGTSSSNVVNRLSPNADGSAGYGGVQIEQSPSLRAAGYREHVAAAIADAFGELVTKPDAVDGSSTAICDAVAAGQPAPTAEIRGRLWWDDDGDDVQNGGDTGAGGVTVQLLGSTGAVKASTVTGADGSYGFPRLAAGTYKVRVVVSPVLTFAAQDAGADTVDSDVDTGGTTADVLLAAYEVKSTVDAGLRLRAGTGQIGDFVWLDNVVVDGIQDPTEGGIPGVQVDLSDTNGVALASQVTDGGGFYLFTGLPDGDYTLRFTPPAGYEAAPAGQGGDPGLDSDIDAAGTASVTLSAAESNLDVDAGYRVDCQDATLVAYGSEWRRSTSLETDWETPLFDDSGWTEEQASFGYGGPAVESPVTKNGTVVYFRLAFAVEDPSIFDSLDLKLLRSDGAVVYLNGTEVLRSNVPVVSSSETEVTATVAAAVLQTGTNVLAVEVHENDGSLLFDLEMSSRVCRPCLASVALPLDQGTYLYDGSDFERGARTWITMKGSSAQQTGLFSWDVSGLPSDAEVLHAEVEWVIDDRSSSLFHFYPMVASWNEVDANWFLASASPDVSWTQDGANSPTADYEGDEPLASFVFNGTTPYTGNVLLNVSGRELVQSWIRGARANDGIVVPGEAGTNGLDVLSDDSAQPPLLRLVYRSCTP